MPDFPGQPIHGYLISQLHPSRVDPGEILQEYRTTYLLEQFYNLKIGIPWAHLERRLDMMSVLSLCGDSSMRESSRRECSMGVDVGKELHVVILRDDTDDSDRQHLIHLGVCRDFSELDSLMERFHVTHCVIDRHPETHATRAFAARHAGRVHMCFFVNSLRGEPKWNSVDRTVAVNRTDVLDASRAAIRDRKVVLPRRDALIETFARHMTVDAKVLDEDEETGIKLYRYVKTRGENHFSMAFTYALLAVEGVSHRGLWAYIRKEAKRMAEEPED